MDSAEVQPQHLQEQNFGLEYFIPVFQARTFMRNIVQEEFAWKTLIESGWGGHLHRVIARVAISELADIELVDLVPLYVEECVKYPHPNDEGSCEKLSRNAVSYFKWVSEDIPDSMLSELESVFGYGNRSSLSPAVISAYDQETNEKMEDKYFFPRNSFTGERYSEEKFPEYRNAPIPRPTNSEK